MSSPASHPARALAPGAVEQCYREVRERTRALCRTLAPEDYAGQSMPSASPAKWHLAHTSWFFEQFILRELDGYPLFHERYEYLFNSYYNSVGTMHPRPERGLLTRPTIDEVFAYREHVDRELLARLEQIHATGLSARIELGLHHEQQHQELLLTDIKHLFSRNPLRPALIESRNEAPDGAEAPALAFIPVVGGIREIGASGNGFHFDNETPRHRVLLEDFSIANRPVTNAEYRDFIRDGGYRDSQLWLADGWAFINAGEISAPLYWDEALEREFTLSGMREIDPGAPVTHVSYYEADAFARWAGARLPTEAEWETVAEPLPATGHFADAWRFHPRPAPAGDGLVQVYGDTWEWTASPYVAYPGFAPLEGSLGEYNGKFMCNQIVCRGGSCATPAGHVRPSYRNFFYPHERWQFFGIRLARSA